MFKNGFLLFVLCAAVFVTTIQAQDQAKLVQDLEKNYNNLKTHFDKLHEKADTQARAIDITVKKMREYIFDMFHGKEVISKVATATNVKVADEEAMQEKLIECSRDTKAPISDAFEYLSNCAKASNNVDMQKSAMIMLYNSVVQKIKIAGENLKSCTSGPSCADTAAKEVKSVNSELIPSTMTQITNFSGQIDSIPGNIAKCFSTFQLSALKTESFEKPNVEQCFGKKIGNPSLLSKLAGIFSSNKK